MRNFIYILLFAYSASLKAEAFTVFEKDGYFGIKDETGNVTVPAVYEKLGWSDGSTQVHNGVIGFREGNLWGLITAKNKSLTGQKYYTIDPVSSGFFKASLKGRFSNLLFHGIIDDKGKTVVSFNYFSIESLGANWLVSSFDGKTRSFGVVSFDNRLIVDTKYASVREENNLLVGRQAGRRLDLFQLNGELLQRDLDSLLWNQTGWVAYRDGYAGFLSKSGKEIYDFDFKGFTADGHLTEPLNFPEWKIYKRDSVFLTWRCDSLTVGENGLLVAYLNGANHLLTNNNTLLENHELVLKEVINDQLIVQNSKTRKWSVLDLDGLEVMSGYDSIHSIGNLYGCLDKRGWFLVSRNGEFRNRLPLQSVKIGLDDQFLAKRNGYWGVLREDIKSQTTYKYDSIVLADAGYLVSYLNRWGVLNRNEQWDIRSEFEEIIPVGNLIMGRRGHGYTVFSKGEALYKTAFKPKSVLGGHILIEGDSSQLGLMNQHGEVIIPPVYDEIEEWEGYFELISDSGIELRDGSMKAVLAIEEEYQDVNGFNDGYFVVRKENRWGYVDQDGRLRISNRYDDARPFHGGLAAVKLRRKWGFIDKEENIRVQPYYDLVTPFNGGMSIVAHEGKYGLVDNNGREVLELVWKSIHRLNSGNYLVQDIDGLYGLVNDKGSFIFRPDFDHLQDFEDHVLVFKNDAWGILNYERHPIFKINYEEIKVIGDLIIVKQ